jgi:hypothetical protein
MKMLLTLIGPLHVYMYQITTLDPINVHNYYVSITNKLYKELWIEITMILWN